MTGITDGPTGGGTMKALTEAQEAVLDAIRISVEERGVSPSLRELCVEVGLSSTSVAAYHLKSLEEAGYIERIPGIARGIRVVEGVR